MDDCGSRSKQLQQLLSEYETRLELVNSDSEFTEVHSFGPYNFHQEHNKFKALLNGILSRCKKCKSWGNSKQAVKAFVKKPRSCETALKYLTERWKNDLDEGKTIGIVSMDLSKAFDSIPHEPLLEKLKAYGADHQAYNLLRNYLKELQYLANFFNSKESRKDRQQQIKLLLPLKGYIAECLDKLQSVIRENNLTDTIHHLELITRQVGLKFDVSTTYSECFISSDMFYVEVQLEDNGNVLEVKVAHAGEAVTCPALTAILRSAPAAPPLPDQAGSITVHNKKSHCLVYTQSREVPESGTSGSSFTKASEWVFKFTEEALGKRTTYCADRACMEALLDQLRRDYTEFLNHMQGLANLYQLAGDAFQKGKIFQALVTLEKDLKKIAFSDGNQKSFEESVLRGPLGFITPRQGGQLMRLTYFATPVELHDAHAPPHDNSDLHSLSKFGRSLSISVEQSKPRLLPTSSLLSDDRYGMEQEFADDKLGNIYLAISEANSEELPASFVLHLDKPLVVSASILERIHSTLENFKGEKFVQNSKAHMDCLIIKKWLKGKNMEYRSQMAYRQKLPDKEHIYRITEKNLQGSLLQNSNIGVVISRIPFTHCRNVVEIVQLLRQQLVYNQLLTSVLSSQSFQEGDLDLEEENSLCFDVSTCSPFIIVITFEEPITSSLASVEFQVKYDCSVEARFNFSRRAVFYDSGYVSRVIQRCLSIPVTMKYILKKARNVQVNGGYVTPMAVDGDTEASKNSFPTPTTPFHPQSNAVTLLASMIASSDSTSLDGDRTSGLIPLLSPSPTLPNILSTPSPLPSTFPFVFDRKEADRVQVSAESLITAAVKQAEMTPQPLPPKPPIRIKLKKIASSDKYVIEPPKVTKQESTLLVDSTNKECSPMLDTGDFRAGNADPSQYQLGGNVEQFIQPTVNIGDQGMEFSSECVSFSDVDNLSAALLGSAVNVNVTGTSRGADVENIFQTLPGGATGSPSGLDVNDPYAFDAGLDSAFDIEAEIGAACVPSDNPTFDISNVYDPAASTSSVSAMGASFDIDSTFDLDTILASGTQSGDNSVNGGMSLDWNLGTDRGNGGKPY